MYESFLICSRVKNHRYINWYQKNILDEEKIHKIADKLIMGVNGDPADVVQFAQFISKNIHLYKMRNGYHLDTAAAAHFTRQNLITALRSAVS